MNKPGLPLLVALLAPLAAGCGSNPVSYSQPVPIALPAATPCGTVGCTISLIKNVNTAGANPYKDFVRNAQAALGGANPSHIVATGVQLDMLSATGVTTFQQVFKGVVTVSFQMSSSNTVYTMATVTNPTGPGPIVVGSGFDSKGMPAGDYADLIGSNFKVILDGTAADSFATATGENASLQATFAFVAYP
jgi:hypothetical protein